MSFSHLATKFTEPGTICLMVLAATTAFLLLRTKKNLARQRMSEPIASMNRLETDEGSDGTDSCELAMHEKARVFSAQIDTKLALLQTLIAEAQEAATRLEAALSREAELHAPLSDEPDSTGLALDQLDPKKFLMEPSPTADAMGATAADRREEIYTLADYGFNVGEIARRIGRPRGEVELVLSLRAA